MSTQFIDDLATYLQTLGHGTVGTDIFKGNAPDKDGGTYDNIIIVNDIGGLPNLLNEKGAAVEEIAVQIRVRNNKQVNGRDLLLDIQDDLHQLVNTNLGTFTIIRADALDRPALAGRDPKERWNLVSNYEFLVRLS
jgi:hypothetical protein